MATKVVMEALSPTMEEGRLVRWVKKEGEPVAKGDVLAEIETDKAVMELVARGEGVLRKQLRAEGDTAPVGTLLGVIGAAEENIDEVLGSAGGTEAKPAAEVIATADEKAGVTSVPRAAAESQGEASSPPQGKTPPAAPPRTGSTVPRQQPPPAPHPSTERPHHADENGARTRSSPLARRLASERGLDLGAVQGSGPGGRIVKRDIEGAEPRAPAARAAVPVPTATGTEFRDVPLSQLRKTIARRLSESIGPIPTFYLTCAIELTRIAELREAMAAMGEEGGERFRVSYNDILLKAVATTLSHHPEVNAHWLGDRIRMFSRVHLGMAVAIEDGLITPLIFDADRKGLREIAREARELAARARERRLKPEEYTGSTFSVSNLGMFGIDQFTAIINPPEVGILAVGAIEDTPVVENGALAIRKRVRVTMSCDHRAVDGATGAKFLQTLRRMLENPLMMVY